MTHILSHREFVEAIDDESDRIQELHPEEAERPDNAVYWNKHQPVKCGGEYLQTLIWHNAPIYSVYDVAAFKRVAKDALELRHELRWIGKMTTFDLPMQPGSGGREDAAFLLHEEDCDALDHDRRLGFGFRWMFDVFGNGATRQYPLRFRQPYSYAEQVGQERLQTRERNIQVRPPSTWCYRCGVALEEQRTTAEVRMYDPDCELCRDFPCCRCRTVQKVYINARCPSCGSSSTRCAG
jgi:hypothetical protein